MSGSPADSVKFCSWDSGGFLITGCVEMWGSGSSSLLVFSVVVPLFLEHGAQGCFIFISGFGEVCVPEEGEQPYFHLSFLEMR